MTAAWQAEKQQLVGAQKLKEQLEQARIELEQAQRKGDLQRAGELLYGVIPELTKKLETAEAGEQHRMLNEVVGEQRDRRRRLALDRHSRSTRCWRASARSCCIWKMRCAGAWSARTRRSSPSPMPCAGRGPACRIPTGRSARSCSWARPASARPSSPRRWPRSCSTTRRRMIRIDMSEYMEKHSVARLIGAPPGYVGYEEGGSLTEAVRRRPYQVILFDEVEKAHPDVFNVLLQVLDDGRLTDGQGRTVDFRNTLIILTSNLGSDILASQPEGEDIEKLRPMVMEVVRAAFRPEFLNRLDDILLFRRLTRQQMSGIVDIQLKRLEQLLADRKMTIELDEQARTWLANAGYDPVYGARPLKRVIQRELQNPLAGLILEGRITPGEKIRVAVKDGKLAINGETVTDAAA